VTAVVALAGCAPPLAPPARWHQPAGPRPPASPAPATWPAEPVRSWQWQLHGTLDLTVDAEVYELDAFTTPAAAVDRLHTAGKRAVCYVNAGAYEDFRPDAGRFPAAVLGSPNGWPGERWLDVRRWDSLEPVLTDRFTLCRDKGFDAVEADNVDGYANRSGFPLTGQDQLTFNRALARLAHGLGLAVGLKNDLEQAESLEPDFDFAVNEECFRFSECELLDPFVAAGKSVLHVEYAVDTATFCRTTREYGFASMRKHPSLDAWRQPCPTAPGR
jgi:hypothetical protein